MKYILILLGFIIICHNCSGNLVEDEEKISNVISVENASVIESWPDDLYNDTASNASYPQNRNGIGKKVVGKIKGGIKGIKNKIKNFKIGGGGGTSGGGGGSYRRPYISGRGGSFSNNPNDLWILLGVSVAIAVVCVFIIFYLKAKKAPNVAEETRFKN